MTTDYPQPPRFVVTIRDHATHAHAFGEASTPAELLAWVRSVAGLDDPPPRPPPKVPAKVAPVKDAAPVPADLPALKARIYAALPGKPADLARKCGASRPSVRGRLHEMLVAGLIVRDGEEYRVAK